MMRALFRLPVRPPYTLDDMAADTVGLLDVLGIAKAHVVGASMGGMIAQIVAIEHPERVKSLTSIMSTSGDRALPGPKGNVLRALIRPRPRSESMAIRRMIEFFHLVGGSGYPPTEAELQAKVERSRAPQLSPRWPSAPAHRHSDRPQPRANASPRRGPDAWCCMAPKIP